MASANIGVCPGCVLSTGVSDIQRQQLSLIAHPLKYYLQGEKVYSAGDKFKSVYLVQQGSIKTETTTYQGRLVVTGFFLPKDIFGLEGIGSHEYTYNAVAIEDSLVCEIPFQDLQQLCFLADDIQYQLFMLMGQRIGVHDHALIMMQNIPAQARFCRFLSVYYERIKCTHNHQATIVSLPMNKYDIACYLGICPETLSRILADLIDKGIICKGKKSLELLDIDALNKLAC